MDSIFALMDYQTGGENLVNAIVKALSSSLGFAAGAAGMTALIGLMVGGTGGAAAVTLPGWAGPVIFGSGMAGAWLGEKLGNVILSKLAGIEKLANMDDPIAASLGLSPRKIIRDPFGEKGDDLVRKDTEDTKKKDTIISSNGNTNAAEGLDGKTSYGSNGVVAVEKNTTVIQPVEV